jgi:hypothetical protein
MLPPIKRLLALAVCVSSDRSLGTRGKEHRLGRIGGIGEGQRATGREGAWVKGVFGWKHELRLSACAWDSIQREQRVCCATCSGMPSPDLLDATLILH